jgi:type IX secretion system PorP/SprF family membrane protein
MRFPLILLLTCCCVSAAFAQNTMRPNIYFENMSFYNAAAATDGVNLSPTVSLYLKDKFVDDQNDEIWHKPPIAAISYLARIDDLATYHVAYIYDGYSFYSRNTLYAGYARKLRRTDESSLALGGRLVLNFDHVDWDELTQVGEEPPASSHLTPDCDLGIQYELKRLTLGASVKNLLASSFRVDGEDLIKDWREFYVNGSYTFIIGDDHFRISPNILYMSERDIEMDVGVNVGIYEVVDVSYALRAFELRNIVGARVALWKRYQLGGAVDFSSVFSDTNVDFMIRYRF